MVQKVVQPPIAEELFAHFLTADVTAAAKGSFKKTVTEYFNSDWTKGVSGSFTYDDDEMKQVAVRFETWKKNKNKQYKAQNGQGWRLSKNNDKAAQALNTALGKLGVNDCMTPSRIQVGYLKNATLQPKSTNLQPRTGWGKKIYNAAMTPHGLDDYSPKHFQRVLGMPGEKLDSILKYFSGMILAGMDNAQGRLAGFPAAIGTLIRGIEDTFGGSDKTAFLVTLTDTALQKIRETADRIWVKIKSTLLGHFNHIVDFCSSAKNVYTLSNQDKTALQGISGSEVVWNAITKLQVERITPIWNKFKDGLKAILEMGIKLVTRVVLAVLSGGITVGFEAGLKAAKKIALQIPSMAAHLKTFDSGKAHTLINDATNMATQNIALPQSFDKAMKKLELFLAKGNIAIGADEIVNLNAKFRQLTQDNVHELMTNTLIASYFVCNHSNKDLTNIDLTASSKFNKDINTSLGQLRKFAENYIKNSDYELIPAYSYNKRNIDPAGTEWPTFARPCPPEPDYEVQPTPSIKLPKSDAKVAAMAGYKGTFLTQKNLFRDGSTRKLKDYNLIKSGHESITRDVFITHSKAFGMSGRSLLTDSIDTLISHYFSATWFAKNSKGTDSYLDSLDTRETILQSLIGKEKAYFAGGLHSPKHGRGFKFSHLKRVLESELESVNDEQDLVRKPSITSTSTIPIVRKDRAMAFRNKVKLDKYEVSLKQWKQEKAAHDALVVEAQKSRRWRLVRKGLTNWAEHINEVKHAKWGAEKVENLLTIPVTKKERSMYPIYEKYESEEEISFNLL